MCYLAHYPADVSPVAGHREAAAELNPDGHGWAMLAEDKLVAHHGMDFRKIAASFDAARARYPDAPALWHSRHAGSMPVARHLCHPLVVGRDLSTVVAHNGYLFPVDEPGKSDTVVFAEDILPYYDLNNFWDVDLLEERMGRNKAVVLSANPAEPQVTILNERLGLWRDGAWHSNRDFLGIAHVKVGWCSQCGASTDNTTICLDCNEAANHRHALLMEGKK